MSAKPAVLLLRKYQMPEASTTPGVVLPSPFQSPTTGFHPAAPKANGAKFGWPWWLSFLRYQVAGGWPNWPIGSNTPMVVLPSPSQSPMTGAQPGAP